MDPGQSLSKRLLIDSVVGGTMQLNETENKERAKNMGKQVQNIKKRMSRAALEYEETHPTKESPHKARMNKIINESKNQQLTKNYDMLEKNLHELARLLNPKVLQFCFY